MGRLIPVVVAICIFGIVSSCFYHSRGGRNAHSLRGLLVPAPHLVRNWPPKSSETPLNRGNHRHEQSQD